MVQQGETNLVEADEFEKSSEGKDCRSITSSNLTSSRSCESPRDDGLERKSEQSPERLIQEPIEYFEVKDTDANDVDHPD